MAKTEILINMTQSCFNVYHTWSKTQATVQPKITGVKLTVSFNDGKTDVIQIGEVNES